MVCQFSITIMFLPNQVYPRIICSIKKLVKVLQKQIFILCFKVEDTRTTFSLGQAHICHLAFGGIFGIDITTSP